MFAKHHTPPLDPHGIETRIPPASKPQMSALTKSAPANVSQTHTYQAPYSAIRLTRDRSKRVARSQAADVNTNQIHNRAILHYSTHAEKKQAECRLRARRRTIVYAECSQTVLCAAYFSRGGAERLRVVLCAAYLPRGGSLEPKYQFRISSEVITPSRRSCIRSSNSAARSATMLSSKAKSIK